jgi:hypothetical protein
VYGAEQDDGGGVCTVGHTRSRPQARTCNDPYDQDLYWKYHHIAAILHQGLRPSQISEIPWCDVDNCLGIGIAIGEEQTAAPDLAEKI